MNWIILPIILVSTVVALLIISKRKTTETTIRQNNSFDLEEAALTSAKSIIIPKSIELKMKEFLYELEIAFSSEQYMKKRFIRELEEKYGFFSKRISLRISKHPLAKEFIETYSLMPDLVKHHNEEYISKKKIEYQHSLPVINGHELDDYQKAAVLSKEENILVNAGAGSGKSTTIIGKVKILIEEESVDPSQILVLSFTKASALDMNKLLSEVLPEYKIQASTFHSLGRSIIKETTGTSVNVEPGPSNNFLPSFITYLISGQSPNSSLFYEFIALYYNIPEDVNDFFDEKFREKYNDTSYNYETLRNQLAKNGGFSKEYETLNKHYVKSVEELVLANYLFLNGVNYEYEKNYAVGREQGWDYGYGWDRYHPDFYLPDYDIYLEHFGISKDFKAPWLSDTEGKHYVENIYKKREIHKHNQTTLVETYSFYNTEGRLVEELEILLDGLGIKRSTENLKLLYESESLRNSIEVTNFTSLLSTFINLFKSSNNSIEIFDDWFHQVRALPDFTRKRETIFLSIAKEALIQYRESLEKNRKIDFHDMINQAAEFVSEKRYKSPFAHIIIDEYQDISNSRYHLVNELKKHQDAQIFAVGDDWQAIYRFTGSDLSLFTDFEKYFGDTDHRNIVKTYRNSQELIDISGKFVMKNPKQTSKQLISDKSLQHPIIIMDAKKERYSQILETIFDQIIEDNAGNEKVEVLFLYRMNKDLEVLNSVKWIVKAKDGLTLTDGKYKNIHIMNKTVHSSKGLQADEVIILNMNDSLNGFPNKREDDDLLRYVNNTKDDFEFEEERRLFYVALTRTKNHTYILSDPIKPSVFVEELLDNSKYPAVSHGNQETEVSAHKTKLKCPKCKVGKLLCGPTKKGTLYYKCTFSRCGFTYFDNTKSPEKLPIYIKCDKCGGYRIKLPGVGKYGDYYKCEYGCGNLNAEQYMNDLED
ncbi:UvrD-helicase domain-containing protein [Candidatus Enterococcus ferrettii]|uniref:DNA 3'-5' helicase n=1 Tax=Candidatus Enterococcus ferrettii TaxID=2815324 RepID=A0ABV0ELP9_9ENTE|nr:UvrD-helicase domain-containing protein [Enterococcus sp. 665A]MBO1338228.1 UvrD-helicase domain-containing protein [Enterococcus sp. 665A]